MKLLYTLLPIILFTSIQAQNVAIPDANFEQKLIDLGYDSGVPDGAVLSSSIDTITVLDIRNSSISGLYGIGNFTSLETLHCNSNQLTSLNLSQNSALKYLNCSFNQLSSIVVSQNSALEFLNCDNNQITYLDITQNTLLKQLGCGGNNLTSLDVSQQILLKELSCGMNELTSLDIEQNIALEVLNCYFNELTNLDITHNPLIVRLFCFSNQLTEINVTQHTALNRLHCSNNQLSSLDVSQNTELINLACSQNQISTLDISQNDSLTILNCSENELTCLNAKNGANINLTNFNADNNPNLTCIEVDDTAYSSINWTNIDTQTSFSTSCGNSCSGTVSVSEKSLSNLSVYPNPAVNTLNINSEEKIESIEILDLSGRTVMKEMNQQNNVNVEQLKSGVYIIRILSEDGKYETTQFAKE